MLRRWRTWRGVTVNIPLPFLLLTYIGQPSPGKNHPHTLHINETNDNPDVFILLYTRIHIHRWFDHMCRVQTVLCKMNNETFSSCCSSSRKQYNALCVTRTLFINMSRRSAICFDTFSRLFGQNAFNLNRVVFVSVFQSRAQPIVFLSRCERAMRQCLKFDVRVLRYFKYDTKVCSRNQWRPNYGRYGQRYRKSSTPNYSNHLPLQNHRGLLKQRLLNYLISH